MTKPARIQGRVIRRYRRYIPVKDFYKWTSVIRTKTRGHGLYALYKNKELLYVGLATKSIRSRISSHKRKGKIPFTHFSVFLVTGRSDSALKLRIRDLEALLLNVMEHRPNWNKSITKFVRAKELQEKDSRH